MPGQMFFIFKIKTGSIPGLFSFAKTFAQNFLHGSNHGGSTSVQPKLFCLHQ
ncbi:hypothetical protein RchiOBHm_Chr1g0332331 [Rosa chinensis]|uniref:Uncharacterized protein n=1 Tax=Rosa chinensis TaxID=74649 RepID=A0A2P6SBS2_ROSCH|nr:hypothetical protein RchiOBHm_Chr1g0332331 [Rosa chinensis]